MNKKRIFHMKAQREGLQGKIPQDFVLARVEDAIENESGGFDDGRVGLY